ncbi:MAG: glycoside hydrolase family 127 protein [Verrucomicrobia bacterium]|nr:glycoside hydrolase family 127 protein [Verrucomicrobiota bacterium]MBU4292222.1 glycoside hydrolase family 127 protein [Verrucomicrobiota bacterium]MBU4428609.1 glycoside hydrolase family 127 protein [Verrucomicrobiota bacterium]MCG2678388.1 glycoside hydrolase family 127 protein [Kiritimatiellia bacterium]
MKSPYPSTPQRHDFAAHPTTLKRVPALLKNVSFNGGFWAPRLETNRRVTLSTEYRLCKQTGHIDAWKLNWKPGQPNPPHIFWDSDLAKWIEAAAYSLATHPDRMLEKRVDGVVDLMAKAQAPDGYLNTHFLAVEPAKRWTNLRDCHELYCAGHLIEGAVAYYQATGKKKMLDVLCRYADHIDSVFGREKGKKRGYCGHEEVELALVKLYRATGKRRYLKLAKFFIDERGRRFPHYFDLEAKARGKDPGKWNAERYRPHQAHLPVRAQTKLAGHAVRALYLCSGMADVAAETGDRTLLAACKRLWQNVTSQRMYITGGVGSAHAGERFTFDYDLPNESAYAETCANIALVFFAQRLLNIEADARYADVMERTLYNGVLSGVSLDGKRFFYVNPLAQHPDAFRSSNWVTERQKWFGCACCPPNIARLFASLGQYVYSQGPNEITVHLYAQGIARFKMGNRAVRLTQRTEYPWQETAEISVNPDAPMKFTLSLRIPGWCRRTAIRINGKPLSLRPLMRKGYARIRRRWKPGDRVELTFPMPVERIEAHPAVRMDCGRVALQRGPIVYCLEEIDNRANLDDICLPRSSRLTAKFNPRLLNGAVVITGQGLRRNPARWDGQLYRMEASKTKSVALKAIPYFLWNNRKPGEMLVWIREVNSAGGGRRRTASGYRG